MKGRVTKMGLVEEKKRDTHRESLNPLILSPHDHRQPAWTKPNERARNYRFPMWAAGAQALGLSSTVFPGHISRGMDRKNSS